MKPAPSASPSQLDELLDRLARLDVERPSYLPSGVEPDPGTLAAWRTAERNALALAVVHLCVSVRATGGAVRLTLPDVEPAALPTLDLVHPVDERVEDEVPASEAGSNGIVAARHPVTRLVRPEVPSRPPPRPAAVPPPATSADIASLRVAFENRDGFGGRVEMTIAEWAPRVERILRELAPQDDPLAEARLLAETAEGIEMAGPGSWVGFPSDIQQGLVGWLVCRLRQVQPLLSPGSVDRAYSLASGFMKRQQPGFVYGLSRNHPPPPWGWDEEGERHRERLVAALPPKPTAVGPNPDKLLAEVEACAAEAASLDVASPIREAVLATLRRSTLAAVDAGVPIHHPKLVSTLRAVPAEVLVGRAFQRLRRAIEEAAEAEAETEDVVPVLSETWPWWAYTRGKHAVVVGGDPREPNRVRLEEVFGFAALDWIGTEFKRNGLQSVRDRVQSGSVDLVLLLRRFIGHDADQVVLPACRQTNTPWVSVEQGYGVVRVRQGIERYLPARLA